jgi:hypothetical protein
LCLDRRTNRADRARAALDRRPLHRKNTYTPARPQPLEAYAPPRCRGRYQLDALVALDNFAWARSRFLNLSPSDESIQACALREELTMAAPPLLDIVSSLCEVDWWCG